LIPTNQRTPAAATTHMYRGWACMKKEL